jgi:nucleoside-diphosphate-sugar epimerase
MGPFLKARGYDVVGLDTVYYNEACRFGPDLADIPTIRKDVRDVVVEDLEGVDTVIHLAALSNDPVGNLREHWTHEINGQASVNLARLARQAGVRRFLFSSSCSMHGTSSAAKVDEATPVHPITPYGASKIQAEQGIAALADDVFSPTFLRNGTVYGASPRLRVDIVLNNLVGWASTTGRVRLMTDGTPWRPVIHLEDLCEAFLTVMESPRELVHNEVFHVGSNRDNYQIRDLAAIVSRVVPGCEIDYAGGADADRRTYIADFTKIERRLGFQPRWTAEQGARQLYEAYTRAGLTLEQFTSSRYIRVKRITELLRDGELDDTLRWKHAVEPSCQPSQHRSQAK